MNKAAADRSIHFEKCCHSQRTTQVYLRRCHRSRATFGWKLTTYESKKQMTRIDRMRREIITTSNKREGCERFRAPHPKTNSKACIYNSPPEVDLWPCQELHAFGLHRMVEPVPTAAPAGKRISTTSRCEWGALHGLLKFLRCSRCRKEEKQVFRLNKSEGSCMYLGKPVSAPVLPEIAR